MVKTRKLPLQFRESKEKRLVTFTKRRKGLFSKAAELSMLCDAQVAILVSSPCSKQKVFSFGPTSTDVILESFLSSRIPEKMDNGTKRLAFSLSTEIKALDTELSRITQNKKKAEVSGVVGDISPWMIIAEFEKSTKSVEGICALIDSLEKLKVRAENMLRNTSSHKFPTYGSNSSGSMGITTRTTFATSKDTDNHNPYDYGSKLQARSVGLSSIYEHKEKAKVAYGYDLAGYNRPLCSFNGQDNISSNYNGHKFPLGGDMNGFGNGNNPQGLNFGFDYKNKDVLVTAGVNGINTSLHNATFGYYNENNILSCNKNSWNLPESEYDSCFNGLRNCNKNTSISLFADDRMMKQQYCDQIFFAETGAFPDLDYRRHQDVYWGSSSGSNGQCFDSSFMKEFVGQTFI